MHKKKPDILVVEDEGLIAASLVKVLEVLGYTAPEPVSTGEDAILAVRTLHPDLVLMDIELIGAMDGIEAAEKIRAIADIPIVYLTSYTDEQRLAQAVLTEPYGYLVKPVQSRELRATIEMALYKNKADRALKESEERYRAVVTQAGEAIAIFDSGTKQILEVNPAFMRLFGYTDEEIPTLTFYDIVAGEPQTVNRDIKKILTGHQCSFGEQKYRCKDRSEILVEVSGCVIERGGKPAVVCIIAHDITGRKRAENALFLANKKLNLLSSITRHDVLNKMTILLGYLGQVKKRVSDPALATQIEKATHAARDIREFIEFTRIYQNLGIGTAGWQKVESLLFRTRSPEIQLVTTNLSGLEIFSDPMLIKVFENLFDNAIRHGERVNVVQVSFRKTPDGLILIWEDNGVGIPADIKEQIFERGFGKNTGIGLFLAREILDITGITIKENGEPGKGARFGITVPEGMYRFGESERGGTGAV
jgi:PAS domain S-box-containing protein